VTLVVLAVLPQPTLFEKTTQVDLFRTRSEDYSAGHKPAGDEFRNDSGKKAGETS
jgi:hypothetical protein